MAQREIRAHHDQPYADEAVCLHFVGDMLCARHSEIEYHRNPGFEVCLIPSGKGLFRIDDAMYPVENDQLFLTERHQVHGGWPSVEAPFRILYFCFSIRDGNHCADPFWADVYGRLTSIRHPVCADREGLQLLHARLMQEISEPGPDSRVILSALLKLYLLLLLRNYEQPVDMPSPGATALHVIRYIDSHLDTMIRLADIAAAHHQSISSLTRRFRRETGFSVMEYCHMARLEKAKAQLADPDRTISAVAASLQFGSIHHFSHSFKAMYGISPSRYRSTRLP